jgi:hypothetical protein
MRSIPLTKKPGKHTPYFELVDAQAMAGCPICRLVYKAIDRFLDGILYEATLDREVRETLKHSHGFCAEHVEILRNRPGRALGIALIYRDVVRRRLLEALDTARYTDEPSRLARWLGRGGRNAALRRRLTPDAPCPACAIKHQAASNYLDLLIAHLDDAKLFEAYSQGEGLCLEHFIAALERVDNPEAFRRLIEPQDARYRQMLADLDEYIRKRDHRFTDAKFGDEGDVWLRVMNAITGGAGMGLSARSGGRRSHDLF